MSYQNAPVWIILSSLHNSLTRMGLIHGRQVLRQFGIFSGLKINTEKKNKYLDRKRKFSSDKLIPRNFDLNFAKFNLLGLNF